MVTTNTQTGKVSEGNYPYVIDGDGDAKIAIGDFRLVFRFPDHPDAGTGNTAFDPDEPGRVPLSPSAQPTDGLRRGGYTFSFLTMNHLTLGAALFAAC